MTHSRLAWKPPTGARRPLSFPPSGSETVTGPTACDCGSHDLRGVGPVQGRDTITSQAECASCGVNRGQLIVTVSTIFGLQEDAAVLVHGRARVYS